MKGKFTFESRKWRMRRLLKWNQTPHLFILVRERSRKPSRQQLDEKTGGRHLNSMPGSWETAWNVYSGDTFSLFWRVLKYPRKRVRRRVRRRGEGWSVSTMSSGGMDDIGDGERHRLRFLNVYVDCPVKSCFQHTQIPDILVKPLHTRVHGTRVHDV